MSIDLDQILDKAREAAGAVAKKTDDVVEFSKLKYERSKLNAELARFYKELGQATYASVKGDETAETMDALIEEIELLFLDMAALDDLIAEKRKLIICAKCGAKINQQSAFCSACGAPIPEKPKAEGCQCGCDEGCDCDGECDCGGDCTCGEECACHAETEIETETEIEE